MKKIRFCGVIPSRYGSVRFPGKSLALIKGKPMVQRVYEQCIKSKMLDYVVVATDDKRIADTVTGFGGNFVMTSSDLNSGTDRVAQAVLRIDTQYVINIQGDEPLIDPQIIDSVAQSMVDSEEVYMSTPISVFGAGEDVNNPNFVKAVVDNDNYAIYFSRSPIPYIRDKNSAGPQIFYKHIGLYGYKKDFLLELVRLPQSRIELAEQLEQLRVLENGYKIKTVVVKYNGMGVDTPSDVEEIEKRL